MTPACFCGVTGLRPTYGPVSRHGCMPLSWTLDKIGVLAHSADDCGLVLHQIAGGDDADPGSAHKKFYYLPEFQENFPKLKIGYAEIDFAEWTDEPLRPAFANALSVVKSIGAEMVEATSAAVGPGIGPCCYEVGPEVLEAFADLGDGIADGRMLDLPAVARRLLARAGVQTVESAGLCTFCEAELFFSHRRDQGRTGRMGNLAWIEIPDQGTADQGTANQG